MRSIAKKDPICLMMLIQHLETVLRNTVTSIDIAPIIQEIHRRSTINPEQIDCDSLVALEAMNEIEFSRLKLNRTLRDQITEAIIIIEGQFDNPDRRLEFLEQHVTPEKCLGKIVDQHFGLSDSGETKSREKINIRIALCDPFTNKSSVPLQYAHHLYVILLMLIVEKETIFLVNEIKV